MPLKRKLTSDEKCCEDMVVEKPKFRIRAQVVVEAPAFYEGF